MNLEFSPEAREDLDYWKKTDSKKLKRILLLLNNIQESPFEGLGKPEPLKHDLSGFWSRRIDSEHRLVYRIKNSTTIDIAQARYYYK